MMSNVMVKNNRDLVTCFFHFDVLVLQWSI